MINIQKNGRSLAINFMCIALFFLLVLIPISTKAEIIIRPNSFDEIEPTLRPEDAIDTNSSSYAVISAVPNADPYIIYSWGSDENYDSVFLNIRLHSNNFTNDKWGIKYSLDYGDSWIILKEMSSENIVSLVIREDIGSLNPLSNLKIKIDTDSKGKVDGGIINIYDIFAEVSTSGSAEPILSQSSYRFFENVPLENISLGVAGVDEARAIATHGAYMYVAGFQPAGWRIEKRNLLDGALVDSVTNDCAGEPHAVFADNGFIYIVGDDYTEGNYQWRIEKYNEDLNLVQSFLSNPSEGDDTAYDIVIAGSFIYIAGSDRTHGDSQWRIEKRDLINGSLVGGDSGIIYSNPSNDNDVPYALATDGSNLYVGGYDRIPKISTKPGKDKKATSNAQWRLEKRSLTDLSLLQIIQVNPKNNSDAIKDIAIDNHFIYLAGYQEEDFFDTAWRVEKRNLSDLSFSDIGNGMGWVKTINPGYHDSPESIVLYGEYIYLAGFSADEGSGGDTAWRIEKWNKEDGGYEPDGFSIVHDIDGDYNDRAYGIAIDDVFDLMYIVGYEQPDLADWRIEIRDTQDGILLAPLPAPLSGYDESALLGVGEPFRLKILIHVDENSLLLSQGEFNLQVAEIQTIDDICSDQLEYNDVVQVAGSGILFNTSLGTDGYAVKRTMEDPYIEGEITRYQSYEKTNPFNNGVSEILVGENGLWDFSLIAVNEGSYCFQIVKDNDGSALLLDVDFPKVKVE